MKNCTALLLVLLLAGCATSVSREEAQSVSYGPRPERWQEAIREYLNPRIPDPERVRIAYRTEPRQMLQRATAVRGQQWGWATCVWVDENHPRGYQRLYPMTFFFRDGRIVAVNGGPDDDANLVGAKYAREQCAELGSPFTVR